MRSRTAASVLIVGYLAFQAIYPIRGMIRDKFDTWGAFSWNMYSQGYDCQPKYAVVDSAGKQHLLDFRKYFVLPDKASHVLNRAALPTFHKYLCEQLPWDRKNGRLMAAVACRKNGVVIEALTDSTANLCTAPNFGVTAG